MESSWYELRYTLAAHVRVARRDGGRLLDERRPVHRRRRARDQAPHLRPLLHEDAARLGLDSEGHRRAVRAPVEPGHGRQGDLSAASTTTTCIRRRSRTARCVHCGKPVIVGRTEKMSKSLQERRRAAAAHREVRRRHGAHLLAVRGAARLDARVVGRGRRGRVALLEPRVSHGREVHGGGLRGQGVGGAEAEDARDHQARDRGRRGLQVQHGDRGHHGAGERHLRGDRGRSRGGRVGGAAARADGAAPVRGDVAAARPRRDGDAGDAPVADVGRGGGGEEAR